MDIISLKCKYNELLQREKKAESYLNAATEEQLEKWMPAYNEIIRNLSGLIFEYRKITSMEMTTEEILEGLEVK